jgi:hypothetical protein
MDARGTPFEDDYAMAKQNRLFDRVRDKNHRSWPLVPDAQQFELQNFAGLSVYSGEWFIHQENVGFDSERAGKTATLLHATRHLVGKCIFEAPKPDKLNELRHLPFDLHLRRPGHAKTISDVFEYRLPWEKPEVLKDHGDASDRLGNALLPDPDLASIVRQQTVDTAKQRGLATARWADDCDYLALADVKVDLAENFERTVVLAESTDTDAWLALGGLGCRCPADSGSRCCLTRHFAACLAGF